MRVLKYPICKCSDVCGILGVHVWLPVGSTVLSVGEQRDEVVLWALVEHDGPNEPYQFIVAYTGMGLPVFPPVAFVGTVQASDESVYHVFQQARP